MFEVLLSLNIKQYKRKKMGRVAIAIIGRFLVEAPTRCLAMLVTRLLLTCVSNIDKAEQQSLLFKKH